MNLVSALEAVPLLEALREAPRGPEHLRSFAFRGFGFRGWGWGLVLGIGASSGSGF